jgi:uncharacterized RDD family membrane protein YckC
MTTDNAYGYGGAQTAWPGEGYPALRTDGVLSRRLFAYLVDILAISALIVLFGFLIGVFGVLTFGLGWMLYAILVPGTAIVYSAVTVGGPSQGTIGMRMTGLVACHSQTGGPAGALKAGFHALLFYLAAGTFLLLVVDVVIGFARQDRRLGHDLLAGIILVRRW